MTISGKPLGSPAVDHPDVLVAFNRPSLEKFAPAVRKGGAIIYDSMAGQFQGPEGVKVISVPATEIATEHGAIKAANTAMAALMQADNPDDARPKQFSMQGLTRAFCRNLFTLKREYQERILSSHPF